jgi:hypothetical protein
MDNFAARLRGFPASAKLGVLPHRGEVSERLKEPASKAGSLPKAGSWVRIPPSPPCTIRCMAPRFLVVPFVLKFEARDVERSESKHCDAAVLAAARARGSVRCDHGSAGFAKAGLL